MSADGLGQIAIGDADAAVAGVTARVHGRVQRHAGVPDKQAQQNGKAKFSTGYRHVRYDRCYEAWFNAA